MGLRPIVAGLITAALLTAPLTACGATPLPAESSLSLQRSQVATQATAPVRTVKITSLRTTDYTKGTLTVAGTLTPAPAAGSRIALQRWSSTAGWQEIGHASSSGTQVTISANQPGSIRTYRLAIGPQAPYAAAASAPAGFYHYVWRGIYKKPLLATGGKGHPQYNVVSPSEAPRRAEAELLADKGGVVWGDINSAGCTWVKNWLGNITDGTIRALLLNGSTVLGTLDQAQETEGWLNRKITGVTRLRLQIADVRSGYGPQVATDSMLLCTN
ncbi:hypothetical protein [Kribbella monticola]|uniref:hypothetical protein n=1 Tax=Kribbella monticola TaxID=2185285 RepID=UPI000DD46330|nr:hypothetical protein [Kribbella monticola]